MDDNKRHLRQVMDIISVNCIGSLVVSIFYELNRSNVYQSFSLGVVIKGWLIYTGAVTSVITIIYLITGRK